MGHGGGGGGCYLGGLITGLKKTFKNKLHGSADQYSLFLSFQRSWTIKFISIQSRGGLYLFFFFFWHKGSWTYIWGGGTYKQKFTVWELYWNEETRKLSSMTICKIFRVVPLSGYKVFLLQVTCTLGLNQNFLSAMNINWNKVGWMLVYPSNISDL